MRALDTAGSLLEVAPAAVHRATAGYQGQLPPFEIGCGALCPSHCSSHVALAPQLTEQEAVHVTVQFVPAAHVTLALSPTVTWHEEFG
jgi:hypothetical protein